MPWGNQMGNSTGPVDKRRLWNSYSARKSSGASDMFPAAKASSE
jgi:hypothetical protein